MRCDYCQEKAELVGGKVIYPHRPDLFHKWFWRCEPCQAFVGCHPGGDMPLGRLAKHELRKLKQAAHAAFDPLWTSGKMSRKAAYRKLSRALGVEWGKCHIGMFDEEMCKRVIEVTREMSNG